MITLGFGGGCHWCTEAVFQALRDVTEVRQGFIRSDPPADSYSEAVEVVFDPKVISITTLVRVHLATHASTRNHSMRGKYRSAVYVQTDADHDTVREAIDATAQETDQAFVTAVLRHRGFKPSDARFQNYRAQDPARPFCQTYIDPKLAKLRAGFSDLLRDDTCEA